jgi:hypothetical protein
VVEYGGGEKGVEKEREKGRCYIITITSVNDTKHKSVFGSRT